MTKALLAWCPVERGVLHSRHREVALEAGLEGVCEAGAVRFHPVSCLGEALGDD